MKLLIIDGPNLAYRAYHTFASFCNSTGHPTGMIFGFLSILKSYKDMYPGHKVVIAWEGGKSWRKELYPEYKAHRVKNRDPLIFQCMDELRDLCRYIGILQVSIKGYEADDIISFIVSRFNTDIKIVSRDKDLLQLIDDENNVQVLRPTPKGGFELYDSAAVKKEFGVPLEVLVDYLAIVGDSSDNIKGIRGVGPVKAKQFLLNVKGSIDAALKKIYPTDYTKVQLNKELISLKNEHRIKNINPTSISISTPQLIKLNSLLNYFEITKLIARELIEDFYDIEFNQIFYKKLTEQINYRWSK